MRNLVRISAIGVAALLSAQQDLHADSTVEASTRFESAAITAASWPGLGGNPQHNGRTSAQTLTRPTKKWRFHHTGSSGNSSSPAVAADETAYFLTRSTSGAVLHAVSRTGSGVWSLTFPNTEIGHRTAPVIAGDGTIVFLASTSGTAALYAITPTGSVRWVRSYTQRAPTEAEPIALADRIVVPLGFNNNEPGLVLVVSLSGSSLWQYTHPDADWFGTPASDHSGRILVTSIDRDGTNERLHSITPAGGGDWTIRLDGSGGIPSVGDDGTVFLAYSRYTGGGNYDYWVAAVAPTGLPKWTTRVGGKAFSIAIGTDEKIYVPHVFGMSALSATDGRTLWQEGYGGNLGQNRNAVITRDGTVYHQFHAHNSAGEITWRLSLDPDADLMLSDLAIAPDGNVILSGKNGMLFSYGAGGAAPSASFTTAPSAPVAHQPVQFTDTSIGTPASWSWDFDGNGTTDSAQQHPTYTFQTAATYNVRLTVSNSNGSDTVSKAITVLPNDCAVAPRTENLVIEYRGAQSGCTATGEQPCSVAEAVSFTPTAFGYTFQSCDRFAWNFGDGSTSSARTPTHVFTSAGSRTVTLRVSNQRGEATTTRTLTVGNTALPVPTLTLAAPSGALPNVPITLAATSDIDATGWSWDFGDGSTDNSDASMVGRSSTVSHTFTTSGTFAVRVRARNAADGSSAPTAIATRTVTVGAESLPPVIFAHGFCSDATAWDTMIPLLQSDAARTPARYRGPRDRIDLYFDGQWVRDRSDERRFYPHRAGFPEIQRSQVYTITYFDPDAIGDGFSKTALNDLPIPELAHQLARVVEAVRVINGVPRVDVVGHSMGGLVARAYVQDLATDGRNVTGYRGDVRRIVTVDTPHAGSTLANLASFWSGDPTRECLIESSEHKTALQPQSAFLERLNSAPFPPDVVLTAIASRTHTINGDHIVEFDSQDITHQAAYACAPNIDMIPNVVDGGDFTADLHRAVLKLPVTAQWVDTRLSLHKHTQACRDLSSQPARMTPPTGARAAAYNAFLRFIDQTAGARTTALASTGACEATIIARGVDGAILQQRVVPARDYQQVDMGVLPGGNWELELTASCPMLANVTITAATVSSRRRAVRTPGEMCAASIWPRSVTIGPGVEAVPLNIDVPPGCSWSATAGASWLSLDQRSGVGAGVIRITAAPNACAGGGCAIVTAREAAVSVGQSDITVRQRTPERVANGRFDVGPAGLQHWAWSRFGSGSGMTAPVLSIDAGTLPLSRGSMELRGRDAAKPHFMEQCVPLEEGKPYEYGAAIMQHPTLPGTARLDVMEFATTDCTGSPVRTRTNHVAPTTKQEWRMLATTAQPTSDVRSVLLLLGSQAPAAGAEHRAWFDDVFLRHQH